MKIVSIVGARPQFIKLAPLSKRIREKHDEVIVHTGQHYADFMSEKFFQDLHISIPDYNLGIGSHSHGKQTGKMLIGLEEIIFNEKADLVVVFGDTNSTIAGSLTAAKMHIPIVHVEAGLRSFNKTMPEEINRVLTDHCSDILFAPTANAMKNLKNEGLENRAFLTGDIMLDVLIENLEIAKERTSIIKSLELIPHEYFVLTLHRPYNVDRPELLGEILNILGKIDRKIIFPVHPRTYKIIKEFDIKLQKNIQMIEPLGYLDFIWLEKNALKIITDSGGIQKEAFLLEVPCITVRTETEWVETVESGWNIITGFDMRKLLDAICNFSPDGKRSEIFGRYSCAHRMVKIIENHFGAT